MTEYRKWWYCQPCGRATHHEYKPSECQDCGAGEDLIIMWNPHEDDIRERAEKVVTEAIAIHTLDKPGSISIELEKRGNAAKNDGEICLSEFLYTYSGHYNSRAKNHHIGAIEAELNRLMAREMEGSIKPGPKTEGFEWSLGSALTSPDKDPFHVLFRELHGLNGRLCVTQAILSPATHQHVISRYSQNPYAAPGGGNYRAKEIHVFIPGRNYESIPDDTGIPQGAVAPIRYLQPHRALVWEVGNDYSRCEEHAYVPLKVAPGIEKGTFIYEYGIHG